MCITDRHEMTLAIIVALNTYTIIKAVSQFGFFLFPCIERSRAYCLTVVHPSVCLHKLKGGPSDFGTNILQKY